MAPLRKGMSRIYPMCSYCKEVREGTTGIWVEVEKYVKEVTGNVATHGVLPQCYKRVLKELE
jgi:hypothetical protein